MKKELNLMITPAEFPVPLIILPETDSTNNYLTQLCNEQQSAVREFTTVIAERQTAGKGQRGNSWESEDCRNITFSFVLYPTFIEARRQFILSQIVSLSIKEELDQWTEGISIKWPNDIYWSNAPNPISLKQITGKDHDRYLILANIMERVKEYYTLLQADTSNNAADIITERYVRSLFRRNGFHRYADADGEFLACLLRVEPDGRFILKDQTGKEREYLFKEVQYLL